MPYILSKHREEFRPVKVTGTLYDRHHKSNWFEHSYIPEDSEGQRYLRPGMIVAQIDNNKWVPYNASGSYGVGSDGDGTRVGICDTFEILTLGDEAIDPLRMGTVIENHCYIFGSGYGSITSAVKTLLPDVNWV